MPGKSSVGKNQQLIKTLAGGALWITLGMVVSRILGYGIRAAIAHFYGVENYGIINTAQSLMMIFAIVALAGLNTGLPRQLSFYRSRGEGERSKNQVFSALKLGTIFGLLAGTLLFFFADLLAIRVFNTPQLGLFIRIFAIGVPLYVLMELNSAVFKGLKQMSLFTLFHDILRFTLIFLLVLVLGLCHISFNLVSGVYPFTYLMIVLISFTYIFRKFHLIKLGSLSFNTFDRELLGFSVPLMFSGIFWLLLPRTDTILIGGFLNQEAVGLYAAAVPIGQLILIVRQAFSPIVLPLFTELLSRNQRDELALLYYISAKWTMVLALPIFISMLILPKFFIWLIFGKNFLGAAPVLQIVVLGYFIHTIVGPTSNLLIISGKTRLAMLNSFIAFVVSISMNILLIPQFNLLGAAISSVLAYTVFNILNFIQVYRFLKIQPFRRLHLKYIFSGVLPSPALLLAPALGSDILPILIYGMLYLLLLFLLKAFKEEDGLVLKMLMARFKRK